MQWAYSIVAWRHDDNGGVVIGNVFGITTDESEAAAYRKLLRRACRDYPESLGWRLARVSLMRLDESRVTKE